MGCKNKEKDDYFTNFKALFLPYKWYFLGF